MADINDSTDETPGRRRGWRLSRFSLLAALLAFAGMLVFVYPTAASWISQYNQSKAVTGYTDNVATVQPEAAVQLDRARAYNEALNAGAQLEAGLNVPTGDGTSTDDSLDYDAMLTANDEGLMARLKIDAIDLDLPVYHGTSDETLLKGLGHLKGTSLPIGGEGTHAVITGHRGLAQAEMFTDLNKVTVGDRFVIEVFGEVLTYQVSDTQVVEPTDTQTLSVQPGRDLVTLVTCTPLGINTHRILVTGERVEPTPAEDVAAAGAPPEIPRFPWWAVALAAGTVLLGVYVWRSGLTDHPRGGKGRRAPEGGDHVPGPAPGPG
ncbi:Sortase domain [Propionibacterium ruminifibrarum]|uniref:Sortase domain n=1 Tax=Propionibacterium ruminifibrarum TaxID=1962131 RepID=A0A375I2Z8_9ACTN|nr:class C sortase [Propionibacterium ruminifibrarum]SPF69053.1 Sortase domain [Propionibacterium ruminifibrarum]